MFNNCGAIEAFTVAEGNPVFAARGGHLVCIGGTHNPAGTVILIRGANVSEIPDGVNVIGKAAFRRATLAALTIPASVTVIENYAFSDSSILTVNYKGTEDAWQKAICDENGKERMWKSSKQEITVKCSDTVAVSHILVAYFSATGTTKGVAEKIAAVTGGELYEIVPAVPYTQEDLNYSNSTTRATAEQRDPDARPEIKGGIADMGAFDIVFLGYPIWWSKAPKIIYSFLESYEFAGKTIIPFCTSGSSSISGSLSEIQALASDANWLSGMRFEGDATQTTIRDWIDRLGFESIF